MLLSSVIYGEVFDDMCKLNLLPLMFPKPMYHLTLMVAMLLRIFGEQFWGQDTSLQQSIHSLSNLNIHETIQYSIVVQLVVENDFI